MYSYKFDMFSDFFYCCSFSKNGTQFVKHERQNNAVERQYKNLGQKFYVEFVTSGKDTIFVYILSSPQMFEINSSLNFITCRHKYGNIMDF